ncbi:MAG: rhodanese-like domain-containing protein [Propionibacteriaceae bacterium]|jgi:rhodanese-related sulfurtransferase|nr:rhodanese-like domain-containing protein [Propionibacteriaceae bacterium]
MFLRSHRRVAGATLTVAALLVGLLAGCSSSDSDQPTDISQTTATTSTAAETATATATGSTTTTPTTTSDPAAASVDDLTTAVILIDVRTPSEYAAGHLEGAVNIDLQGDFTSGIAQLNPAGSYIVYCRSGKRASDAQAIMEQAGFVDVINAGGYEQASQELDLPIVT